MIACNRLRGLAVVMAAVLVLPAGSLEARTKKGDKLVKLARDAEAEQGITTKRWTITNRHLARIPRIRVISWAPAACGSWPARLTSRRVCG